MEASSARKFVSTTTVLISIVTVSCLETALVFNFRARSAEEMDTCDHALLCELEYYASLAKTLPFPSQISECLADSDEEARKKQHLAYHMLRSTVLYSGRNR